MEAKKPHVWFPHPILSVVLLVTWLLLNTLLQWVMLF